MSSPVETESDAAWNTLVKRGAEIREKIRLNDLENEALFQEYCRIFPAGTIDGEDLAWALNAPAEFDRDTDGELLIDWSPGKDRMVSLSLRADGRLSYAFTWDGEQAHGTAQMPASRYPQQD